MSASTFNLLGPALCAGLLFLSTHIPLGMQVLKKGIIFIDVAIAQWAATGMLLAHHAGFEDSIWLVQISALICALLGASLFSYTERWCGDQQEAFIGLTFVALATLDILLLAGNPHGGEALTQLLAGQLLWITYPQLLPLMISSAVILILYRPLMRWDRLGFYILFALAITASVQWLGVYLVFATLIIPALSSDKICGFRRVITAAITGVFGYGLGLLGSLLIDLPSGPCIVWSQLLLGSLVAGIIHFYTRPTCSTPPLTRQ